MLDSYVSGRYTFFFRYFRKFQQRFDHLLRLVRPRIKKNNTNIRKAIPPAELPAIALRVLASGKSQQSFAFLFRFGR